MLYKIQVREWSDICHTIENAGQAIENTGQALVRQWSYYRKCRSGNRKYRSGTGQALVRQWSYDRKCRSGNRIAQDKTI